MCNCYENKNNNYYPTLDENFNEAVDMFERETSQDELIDLLNTGNIVQRQIAALKIKELRSKEDAISLVQNLIGCDGKIREAVSLKINEFKSSDFLHQEVVYDTFLQAIIDVNSNICRNIISAVDQFKSDKTFCEYFIPKLVSMTEKLIDVVSEFDFQDGKYKVNKEVFKLYWCLETIYYLAEKIDLEVLKSILKRTKDIEEYTIREKTAKILSKNFKDEELTKFRDELKQDRNYYVRRF